MVYIRAEYGIIRPACKYAYSIASRVTPTEVCTDAGLWPAEGPRSMGISEDSLDFDNPGPNLAISG